MTFDDGSDGAQIEGALSNLVGDGLRAVAALPDDANEVFHDLNIFREEELRGRIVA